MKVRAKVKTITKEEIVVRMSKETASALLAYLDHAAVWARTGSPGAAAEEVYGALSDAGIQDLNVGPFLDWSANTE